MEKAIDKKAKEGFTFPEEGHISNEEKMHREPAPDPKGLQPGPDCVQSSLESHPNRE